MNILELAILKKMVGGGGGSGTDNYNDLSNLPQINGETLAGNKSSSNLGLQDEIDSDNKLASDLIDDENQENKFVTSSEKNTWNAKQNAIDSDHKLDADLVDDSESTNKFVTASDKEAWNAKQNEIDSDHKLSSDLVDDANKTNKFVTSTEKNTWNAKQNAIDSDHKLSSSLVSFSEAESAALASGIDSTKVGQISTNQTNILYAINNGVKNELDNFGTTSYESSGVTFTFNKDGSVHIKGTATGANAAFYYYTGTYSYISNIYKGHILSGVTGGAEETYGLLAQYSINGTSWATQEMCKTTPITIKSDYNYINICIIVFSGQTVDTTIYPMLCDPTVWAQSHDFMPPALPNYDLTYLEAEDRASLAEEIDAGAKNKIDWTNHGTKAESGVTFTPNTRTGAITVTGTASADVTYSFNDQYIPNTFGGMILTGAPTGTTYDFCIYVGYSTNGSSEAASGHVYESNQPYTIRNDYPYIRFYICVMNGTNTGGKVFYPMLCTKAAFGVSNKFVPYRPNWDLVSEYVNTARTKLVYCNSQGSSNTHKYTMQFSDFKYAQFTDSETQTCGTYLVSVVTWGYTPKHGLWIVSYSGGNRTYTALTNIVGADAATVSVVTDDGIPYIQVVASGKVAISTLN